MKIMVISPKNKTVFNFRGDLIKEFIGKGHEVIVTGPNEEYIDDIKALGARFIEIPFVKDNVGIRGDLIYCNRLYEAIKREVPDKIFSYTIKPVIYGSIAGKRAGVDEIYPMITGLGRVYTNDNFKTRILQIITGLLYKKAFKGCKKVIFQNWDDLELFVAKKYLPKSKCEKVDGSGVNLDRFNNTKLSKEKTFLMISRIIKEKGVFEFCEAAKIVKKIYPDVKFILLGGYDNSIGAIQPSELEEYINGKIIETPGEVKDVSPILKKAFVFVLPTYYREGIPRTILEAMASGKPVITTDWVGTKEAVEDGVNGFLVPIKDFQALADKMIYMIRNEDETRQMGEKSFEICKNRFDVEIINKKMLDIMGL